MHRGLMAYFQDFVVSVGSLFFLFKFISGGKFSKYYEIVRRLRGGNKHEPGGTKRGMRPLDFLDARTLWEWVLN